LGTTKKKMKKQSKAKNFLQDERAVSEVIGFVLILGILISASTIYFSSQIPEWTKDFESRHTDDVTDDFAEQKSLIDGIKGETFEKTTPVKMSPDKVPILGMSPPGSSLGFIPQYEKFVIRVGGGGVSGSGCWEQNATTGFPYTVDDSSNVDNSSNVTLARQTVECDDEELVNKTVQWGGEVYRNDLIILNSTIYVSPVTGTLKIYATNITVDSSSEIIADGVGFSGGAGGKGANESGECGDGFGAGIGGATGGKGDGGGGAGYGADGGNGGGLGGAGGTSYDSTTIEMGSGGGGGGADTTGDDGGDGGDGGGAILLEAERITIGGVISANGEKGRNGDHSKGGGGAGGSGGGILIKGRNVTISSTLSAKGGNGGDAPPGGATGGGGGAGGRIKIFYESGSVPLNQTAVSGGPASGKDGGVGKTAGVYVYKKDYTASTPYVEEGHFVSIVHDTKSNSTCYGNITWNATTLNGQTFLEMKVRTSRSKMMTGTCSWPYCQVVENGSNISTEAPETTGQRYIQYRAKLSTEDDTKTPVLNWVKINYSSSAQAPELTTSSGVIGFKSNYLYYPNQEIVYEHGAVIKWQHEGGFMLHPPPINITNESGIPAINISMVDLIGSPRSYSGATSTSLKTTCKEHKPISNNISYTNVTFNLTTNYSSVWGKWFNKTLEEESGLDDSYYDVIVTGNNVEVKFYGDVGVGGVRLTLEKTVVKVEI
jgi:hypothetical protein